MDRTGSKLPRKPGHRPSHCQPGRRRSAMVDAQVAGVLFTANPLTGKRRQAVIDANPGLGEAVVSGMTNPDHFVISLSTGEIIERHLGDKQVIIQPTSGGGTKLFEQATQSREA